MKAADSAIRTFWAEDDPVPVVARAVDYPSGHRIPPHRHDRGQLVYASAGVMTVITAAGTWVVPPQRALWVPAGTEHEVRATGRLAMRTLYLRPEAVPWLPEACRVVAVPPLLRELILRTTALARLDDPDGRGGRLVAVILDELRQLATAPLHLPMPEDPRLRRVARALADHPADARTLAAWAREAGASPRTLTRRFQAETGMSFRHWQRQARLLAALVRLAEGRSVTDVALDLGYDSPSAFIAMFRRALGTTPGRYFDDAGAHGADGGAGSAG